MGASRRVPAPAASPQGPVMKPMGSADTLTGILICDTPLRSAALSSEPQHQRLAGLAPHTQQFRGALEGFGTTRVLPIARTVSRGGEEEAPS